MRLFRRSRLKKAEAIAVRIGENLLAQSVLDPGQQQSGRAEVLLRLAKRVCDANPAWSVEPEGLVRRGRSGTAKAHFADLRSALDLLGAVIDADLRETARLPARDHDEVLTRALRRLSGTLGQHSLCEVSEALSPERESAALREQLAESGDDPEEIAEARAELEELAAGLLGASYGALAFADFLDEPQVRPLTALRFFAARHPAWSLSRGELSYRGVPIGRYASDDPVNSIYADMVWALLEQDHPFFREATLRELTLAAMRSWDRELATLYLRSGEERGAATRA